MHEDLIKEINEDKKMGLELSDTAYYNVDDGVTDEPLIVDVPEKPEDTKKPKRFISIPLPDSLRFLCINIAGTMPGFNIPI